MQPMEHCFVMRNSASTSQVLGLLSTLCLSVLHIVEAFNHFAGGISRAIATRPHPGNHNLLMKRGSEWNQVHDDNDRSWLISMLDRLNDSSGKGSEKLWNVPNILTFMRLLCVPSLALVFYLPIQSRNVWCASVFALASITDWLDGWWARKFRISSTFGAFLDPVADKLLVAVASILLCESVGTWMTVCTAIVLCREIAVSALREWMAEVGKRGVVKVGFAGKCKTAAQMVALVLLLLVQSDGVAVPHSALVFELSKYLMISSTVLAVTSGVGYLEAAWPSLTQMKTK